MGKNELLLQAIKIVVNALWKDDPLSIVVNGDKKKITIPKSVILSFFSLIIAIIYLITQTLQILLP